MQLTCKDALDPVTFVSDHQHLLTSLPLFADIPFRILEPFLRKCEYRNLNRHELLLAPGQVNQYLFLLLEGQLAIHIDRLESEKGFLVQPGEFVGEVSIIDGLAPSAYVVAHEDSLILCIHEAHLWSDFFQIPGTARNMLRQIAERLRARNAVVQRSLEQNLRLEHLEKELLIAQQLQAGMLPYQPFFPQHPQVEVDALMKPAKEVGGDFYDAFSLDSEKICVAIGDVAGKGVPAALFMMRSITLLRSEMLKTKDLAQTIHAINTNLSQDNPMSMFVTMMICVLDLSNGLMQYVNGGHNSPLLGNSNDGFKRLAQPKGILVGINPNAIYHVATQNLNPGDALILYTDGVTEAMNPAQEEFTERRLLEFVNDNRKQSASSFITGIHNAILDFATTAEQSDDLTLLALHYRGNSIADSL